MDKVPSLGAAKTAQRSTSPLDGIMERASAFLGLPLVMVFAASVTFAGNTTQTSLSALANYFSSARALSPGSRPRPPDVDLKQLLGVSTSTIQHSLGPPDKLESYMTLECHAAKCWSFTYGPPPAPTPVATDNHDGTVTVRVSTGGPWLLILGFNDDQLSTAFWLGQK